MSQKIDVYFDFISPYAYLGWVRLMRLKQELCLEVTPFPILYAGLLNHWGLTGPAEVPARRNFIFRDVLREARRWNIPFQGARVHPFNPLLPLRLAMAENDPERQEQMIHLLFHALWTNAVDPRNPKELHVLLQESGFPAEQLLEKAGEASVKTALRQNTEKAIELGVFGVPTFFWSGHQIWGQDRLDHLRLALEGQLSLEENPLAEEILARPRGSDRRPPALPG